jgi:protein TonB
MFTNLIESQSHAREFKRRSSFFLITVIAYAIALTAGGVISVMAYDAQLEAQTSSLELMSWVPPVTPEPRRPVEEVRVQPVRRTPTNAQIDPSIRTPIRTEGVAQTSDPTKVPDGVGIKASPIPPVTGSFTIGSVNRDPAPGSIPNTGGCVTCGTTPRVVTVTEKPPTPEPPKPTTQHVASQVLNSKLITAPQPIYPRLAKEAHVQGPVNIQILVDEQGRVISAQVMSGNPMLTFAARDAAMRARFTPTTLNGVPVKIQGVITYNFRLE